MRYPPQPWSVFECALLLRLRDICSSPAEIADHMPGRTASGVYQKLARIGRPYLAKTGTWTDEEKALLTRLWNDEGLSARAIAARMPNRSRDAVIGQARRMKLKSRGSPIKRRSRSFFSRIKAFGCEWITGTPGRDPECGKPCEPGKPYCADHQKLVMGKKKTLTDAERKRREDLGRLSMKRMNSFFFVR